MKRKRRKPDIPTRRSGTFDPDMPSLLELERFDSSSFQQWTAAGRALDALYSSLYFELEPLRQRDGQVLLDALRRAAIQGFEFQEWCRLVDYRCSLTPLSMVGSTNGIGGRFNIGKQIGPGTITPFPSLYLGENYETAFRERFAFSASTSKSGLSATDFALRSEASFSQVRLRGALDYVVDVGDLAALQRFVDVIRKYKTPRSAVTLSRRLAMKSPPMMIRSAMGLQRQLLHPNWRAMPNQFSIPSNSQIFGRLISAAGIHGILYPSVRNSDKRCLAVFPQNWKGTTSFVELMDTAPAPTVLARLDGGACAIN